MRRKVSDEDGLKKGAWTIEEDQKLIHYIQEHGHCKWRSVSLNAGLKRSGRSCRLRWTNYLRPDIKRGGFSNEEEETIIQLHSILGNKWSTIATYLSGRTDNEIKNYWHTRIKKRLLKMGIDPITHGPHLVSVQQLYVLLDSLNRLCIQNFLGNDSEINTNFLNLVTSEPGHDNQLFNTEVTQNQIETLQSNNLLNSKNALPTLYCNNNDSFTGHIEHFLVSTPELGHFEVGLTSSSSSLIHLDSITAYDNGRADTETNTFCIP